MWMCAEYFSFFANSMSIYIFQYNGPLYSIIFHHVSIVHVCFLNIVTTVRKLIFAKIVYSMFFCCVFHSGCYLFLCVAHFSFYAVRSLCDRIFWLYLSILFHLVLDFCIEIVFAYRIVFSV